MKCDLFFPLYNILVGLHTHFTFNLRHNLFLQIHSIKTISVKIFTSHFATEFHLWQIWSFLKEWNIWEFSREARKGAIKPMKFLSGGVSHISWLSPTFVQSEILEEFWLGLLPESVKNSEGSRALIHKHFSGRFSNIALEEFDSPWEHLSRLLLMSQLVLKLLHWPYWRELNHLWTCPPYSGYALQCDFSI